MGRRTRGRPSHLAKAREVPRGRSRPVELLTALVRFVVSLAALAALLGGVPALLLTFADWPIDGLPSGEQVRDIPTTIVSDQALLGVLVVALWLAWALFAGSVLAEGVAQARGLNRSNLNLAGPLQRMAGHLVSSLLLSVGSLGSLASPLPAGAATAPPPKEIVVPGSTAAAMLQPPTRIHIDSSAPHGDALVASVAFVEEAEPDVSTITVQRGDSPWSLAEEHLGDGMRWREIWELNRERPQADGSTWANPKAAIQPGWRLVLPSDAGLPPVPPPPPSSVQAPATAAAAANGRTGAATGAPAAPSDVVVEQGDNFWALAESELTKAWGRAPTDAEIVGYWQTLIDHNRDRLLPPHDPDLIYPGQEFTAPAPSADPLAPPVPPATTPPPAEEIPPEVPRGETPGTPTTTAPEAEAPGSETPGSETPATTAPQGEAPVTTSPSSNGNGSTPTSVTPTTERGANPIPLDPDGGAQQPPAAESGASRDDGKNGSVLPIGLIGGGVALAGVVLLLERRRRAQQRHRARGRRVPLPAPELQHDERVLREGAEIDRARLLDVALRAAAKGSGATGLPPVRWVEATDGAVTLVLGAEAPAPPGFRAIDTHRWLTTRTADELASIAGQAEMPVPTLIPVGTTADDAELLVELESSCVVTVSGPHDETIGLLRAIAVAAATAPWSEQSRTLLVGMQGELTELPWVGETGQLAAAITAAEEHVDRTAAALWALRCQNTAQARAAGVTPEECEPLVVVSAVRPDDRSDHQRLASLSARSHSAVAIVTPAAENAMPIGRRFAIGDDGWLRIDGVDMAVWPHRLDDEDADIVVALLDQATTREDVPAPAIGMDLPTSYVPRPPVVAGADSAPWPPPADGVSATPAVLGADGAPVPPPAPPSAADASGPLAVPGANGGPDAPPAGAPVPPPAPSTPAVLGASGDVGDPSSAGAAVVAGDLGAPGTPAGPGAPGEPDVAGTPGVSGEPGVLAHPGVPVEPAARTEHEAVRRPVPPPPPPPPPPDAPPVPPSVVADPPASPVRRLSDLLSDVDVLVRVLGEVEAVRHVGDDPADRQEEKLVPVRQKGLEAITYLALREAAVDREDLEINLFPDGANAAKTVYNTVSAARALVGDDLFPPPEGGRYELSDRVVTDYGLFCDLVAQADETEDVQAAAELLTEALGLVRGEPFTGVGRSYAWVGPHRGMIVAQVVDAAEELAEVRLATGDWRLAEWAARQGLRAFPSDERMYRLLMRAARAAGNVPGVQRVFRELCEVLADPDLGVEPEDTVHPETIALLEQLTGSLPRHGRMGA